MKYSKREDSYRLGFQSHGNSREREGRSTGKKVPHTGENNQHSSHLYGSKQENKTALQ